MAIPKVAVYYGPPDPERNRSLFESCLRTHQPPALDFLYVVVAELRQRQLSDHYLKVHSFCFETPVLTVGQLFRSLLKVTPVDLLIDEPEKRSLILEILSTETIGTLGTDSSLLPFLSQYITFFKSRHLTEAEQLRLYYAQKKWSIGPSEEALIRLFAKYQQLLTDKGLEDWEGAMGCLYDQLLTGRCEMANVFPELKRLVLEGSSPSSTIEKGVMNLALQDVAEVAVSLACPDSATPQDLREQLSYLPDSEIKWVHHASNDKSSRRKVLSPASREQEIRLVARKIVEARKLDPTASYSSFAVVAGQPDQYSSHISDVFTNCGLPYSFYRGRSGSDGLLLALTRRFVRLLVNDFELTGLFDFLLSPGLKLPEGLTDPELRRLERIGIQSGVSGDFLTWSELLPGFVQISANKIADSDPESAARLRQTFQRLLDLVESFRIEASDPRSMLDWLTVTCERLQAVVPSVSNSPVFLHRRENLLLADFFRSIKQEASVRNNPIVSLEQFSNLVQARISQAKAYSDFAEDTVLVAQPWDIQHLELDGVFWVGLAEGEFPSNPRQHIFLEGIHTSQWGMMSWRQKQEEDRQLHDSLVASNSRMVRTWPKVIGEKAALPSPLVTKDLVESPNPEPPGPTASDQADLAEHIQRGRDTQKSRETQLTSPFLGFLSSDEALDAYRLRFFKTELQLSPSRLEGYVQCGYRYFLRYVLRLEQINTPSDRVPLEAGRLVHRVLHRFMGHGFVDPSTLPEERQGEWQSLQGRRMSRIVDEEFLDLSQREAGPNTFWEDRKEKLTRGLGDGSEGGVLAQFIEQQWHHLQDHSNEDLEMELGPLPLGTITHEGDQARLVPVKLKGKIDRVDSGPDGFQVIDYKTGASPLSRVYYGWGFQLPLYSFMLESEKGVHVSKMTFYSLTHPAEIGPRPIFVRNTGNSSNELIDYYKRKALTAATQLYAGQFPLALLARSKAGCRTCPFRQVCRYDAQWVMNAREAGRFLRDEHILDRGKWLPASDSREGSDGGTGQ